MRIICLLKINFVYLNIFHLTFFVFKKMQLVTFKYGRLQIALVFNYGNEGIIFPF